MQGNSADSARPSLRVPSAPGERNAAPVLNAGRSDCEGWLTKLGGAMHIPPHAAPMRAGSGFTPKNWRRRYFILKKGELSYFKDPKDTDALGVVPLPGRIVAPADPGKRLFNKFGFKVAKEGERSYYICADDAKEMYRWMNALSLAAIQYEKVCGVWCGVM